LSIGRYLALNKIEEIPKENNTSYWILMKKI